MRVRVQILLFLYQLPEDVIMRIEAKHINNKKQGSF